MKFEHQNMSFSSFIISEGENLDILKYLKMDMIFGKVKYLFFFLIFQINVLKIFFHKTREGGPNQFH